MSSLSGCSAARSRSRWVGVTLAFMIASSACSSTAGSTEAEPVLDERASMEAVAACLRSAGWDAEVVTDTFGLELRTYGIDTREQAEVQTEAQNGCVADGIAAGSVIDFNERSEELTRLLHADAVYVAECLRAQGWPARDIAPLEVALKDSTAPLIPYAIEEYMEAGIDPELILTTCPDDLGVSER